MRLVELRIIWTTNLLWHVSRMRPSSSRLTRFVSLSALMETIQSSYMRKRQINLPPGSESPPNRMIRSSTSSRCNTHRYKTSTYPSCRPSKMIWSWMGGEASRSRQRGLQSLRPSPTIYRPCANAYMTMSVILNASSFSSTEKTPIHSCKNYRTSSWARWIWASWQTKSMELRKR